MGTLDYIAEKYNLNLEARSPIEIPNVGRVELAGLFGELGFKVGAEIGVLRGDYSEVLCKENPGLKLYCIDPWVFYPGYRTFRTMGKLELAYQITTELMKPFDCELIRKFSMDAAGDFEDESLDFVYIDANHELRHVVNDIFEWNKKVKRGGIVSGHDYYKSKHSLAANHTVYAVNAHTATYKIRPWFLLGVRARTRDAGEIRDKARSWMWVKE